MSTFMNRALRPKWDEFPSDEDWADQSSSDISSSRMSVESHRYSRTSSSLSAFSADSAAANMSRLKLKQHDDTLDDEELLELEMMKDKLSKLLLGEDMSGGGKGVCTALAVSNAMTNLYATVFGQFKRLEPLPPEKKSMWKRETGCLLSICEFIVDDIPFSRTLPDGNVEVTLTRPRSDICMNLPALKKLDTMLLDILDGFHNTEFWYKEKGNLQTADNSGSFNQRNEEKWWLPVPCVPPRGLSEKTRKQLQHKRESANQMHKAARTINAGILTEIEVPETYVATLPKCGRAGVGDAAYRYMSTTEQFSPDHFLDCLQIKSEHDALDIADRMETSMCVWKRKASMQSSKSSWIGADETKNETLASRAETIMLCLKQRYPQLSQTTLDTCKIQYNKDVGQAILESYSRVLESFAFNVAARIEDVLYMDESMRNNLQ